MADRTVKPCSTALLLLCLFCSPLSKGHNFGPVYALIEFESESELLVEFRRPLIDGRLVNTSLVLNCPALGVPKVISTGEGVSEIWRARCDESGVTRVAIGGLSALVPDALVTIKKQSGDAQNFVLSARNPEVLFQNKPPRVPAYLLLGVEHLLLGYDHVFFVIALMLLISNTWRLVQTITSFTIAHSITLGLASLDLVRVPQAPVEAAIALSLLYLAVENVSKQREQTYGYRYPWLVAFLFGLLHGLGFAGVLREIGLPEDQVGMALFLFNVGIELGQLAVIGVTLAALWILRTILLSLSASSRVLETGRLVPIYMLGSISSYWVIDRVISL